MFLMHSVTRPSTLKSRAKGNFVTTIISRKTNNNFTILYMIYFSARPDQPWGPPSLLYEYRVFPGSKVSPGRAADHSAPSSAAVMEE